MDKNIKLKESQLISLTEESFYIGSNRIYKFIELYINKKTLTLMWLKKGIVLERFIQENRFDSFTDKNVCFLGAIVNVTSKEKLKQFIYFQMFQKNIRKVEDFYGNSEIRSINYRDYDFNSFRVID